jgi:hypothetical protein
VDWALLEAVTFAGTWGMERDDCHEVTSVDTKFRVCGDCNGHGNMEAEGRAGELPWNEVGNDGAPQARLAQGLESIRNPVEVEENGIEVGYCMKVNESAESVDVPE